VPGKRSRNRKLFPASNAVAVHSERPYPVAPAVVTQALIAAPWTA
jgi:hypothetical protein